MSKKAKEGREFELLIERIERILAPKGAIIKSPDYIPDLITGSPREVDVSIRFQEESENRLITLECRDRTGQQDTTWIEQLVTKQKDIGAWRTYAVSTGKFSRPAIEKAKYYGIEIRQFDQITDAEIAEEWALKSSNLKINMIAPEFYYALKFTDANGVDICTEQLSKEYLDNLTNDLSSLNPLDYFSSPERGQFNDWLYDPTTDNMFFYFSLTLNSERESYLEHSGTDEKIVSQIIIDFECRKRILNTSINSVQQYSSPEETITQIIEGEASDGTNNFKINARGRFKPIQIVKNLKRN